MALIWLIRIYCIWFACGFVLLVFDLLPPWLAWSNSVYLMIGGVTAFGWLAARCGMAAAGRFAALCAVVSFAAEGLGVHTGYWFGTYAYGDAFAPLLFGVPLAIPFAWCMMLTIGAYTMRCGSGSWHAAGAATAATAIDLLLDPVAVKQLYWTWTDPGAWSLYTVPYTNFLCWWITAFAIYRIGSRWLRLPPGHQLPRAVQGAPLWTLALREAPLLLLVTLDLLFAVLAIREGVGGAVLLHIVGIVPLLVIRKGATA